jgi:hypothetical protein
MERLLIINGCSHSAGSETEGPGIGDGIVCRNNSFGSMLAEKLDRIPVHLALPGGSNDRIARTSTAWISDNLDKIKNKEIDVLFLVHWTGAERSEYFFPESTFGKADPLKTMFMDYSLDSEYWAVNSGTADHGTTEIQKDIYNSFYKLFVNSLETWSDNKIKNIVYLQSILKQYNVPYWFGDSFFLDYKETQTYNSLVKLIDKKYFPYHTQRDKSYYWMCSDAGYKNQDATGQMWHLNRSAHKYYANWLLEEINKVDLNG